MNPARLPLILALVAPALLAGCAAGAPDTAGLGGGDYVRTQSRAPQHVDKGMIESIRRVRIDATQPNQFKNYALPAAGAIAGGALGSTIGKGKGKKVAIILGAIAGAGAGNVVADAAAVVPGLEIVVRLDNGRTLAFTQSDEGLGLRAGDPVRVLSDGRTWRVAPL